MWFCGFGRLSSICRISAKKIELSDVTKLAISKNRWFSKFQVFKREDLKLVAGKVLQVSCRSRQRSGSEIIQEKTARFLPPGGRG